MNFNDFGFCEEGNLDSLYSSILLSYAKKFSGSEAERNFMYVYRERISISLLLKNLWPYNINKSALKLMQSQFLHCDRHHSKQFHEFVALFPSFSITAKYNIVSVGGVILPAPAPLWLLWYARHIIQRNPKNTIFRTAYYFRFVDGFFPAFYAHRMKQIDWMNGTSIYKQWRKCVLL